MVNFFVESDDSVENDGKLEFASTKLEGIYENFGKDFSSNEPWQNGRKILIHLKLQ